MPAGRQNRAWAPPWSLLATVIYLIALAQGLGAQPMPAPIAGTARASEVKASKQKATITVIGDAYVEMPIWVHITFPRDRDIDNANLRYPFIENPRFAWGHDFEVMQDGQRLPEREDPDGGAVTLNMPGGGSCAPPSSPTGRLPLHIFYRFTRPGHYRVRYVQHEQMWTGSYTGLRTPGGAAKPDKLLLTSEWIEVEVKPFTLAQRRAWQRERLAHPPGDVGLLVGDYLPSLLASPDAEVLPAFLNALYHKDSQVQSFAMGSLCYFGKDTLTRELPKLIKEHGPTPLLAYAPELASAAVAVRRR